MESGTITGNSGVAGMRRLRLLARMRASLVNPSLIGRDGYRKRYLKVQWWVIFWRLVILVQIPETAICCPDQFESIPYAFFLLAIASAYTGVYAWLVTRTEAGGRINLYILDLAVCGALMFLARDSKLLFIMSFFSFSSLLSRPTTMFRAAAPAAAALSLAYLGAEASIGMPPLKLITQMEELGNAILYFFWGLGFVGFSAVLERVSSLELDTLLEEQRNKYRRQLHDDLGNTLCGLHFKIQSLAHINKDEETRSSLDFLSQGYGRASGVLQRLIHGMDEQLPDNFYESVNQLKNELQDELGLEVELTAPESASLSLEVQREVLAIVREAVSNTAKHASAGKATIEIKKQGNNLLITIADDGNGFNGESLTARRQESGMGIKGMRERAKLIRGELEINSKPGSGTVVSLKVRSRGAGSILSRMLDHDPRRSGGGLYQFLVRLRLVMFAWTIIQMLFQVPGRGVNPMLILIMAVLFADCFAFIFLRGPLYQLLSHRPWLLVFEQILFAVLIYLSLWAGYPFFFALYVGVAVIMNGLFLDAIENTAMTLILNLGIFVAFALSPADTAGIIPGHRIEEPLQHTTIFLILGFSAGLAGEFVDSLEGLQLQAVSRVLGRQREKICAQTHRQLHSLVSGLGDEINRLQDASDSKNTMEEEAVRRLESSSEDIKTRLREVLKSLDEPDEEPISVADAA